MDAKLTLKLDKETIEGAKRYAEKHQRSLSRLIESYLRTLAEEPKSPTIKLLPLSGAYQPELSFRQIWITEKLLLKRSLRSMDEGGKDILGYQCAGTC